MDSKSMLRKLENLKERNPDWYRMMTVAELTSKLAGLPPMMEVYVAAENISMFLNDLQVEAVERDGVPAAPFARLIANVHPSPKVFDDSTYEEKLARQKLRAMHLEHGKQEAAKFPSQVD